MNALELAHAMAVSGVTMMCVIEGLSKSEAEGVESACEGALAVSAMAACSSYFIALSTSDASEWNGPEEAVDCILSETFWIYANRDRLSEAARES